MARSAATAAKNSSCSPAWRRGNRSPTLLKPFAARWRTSRCPRASARRHVGRHGQRWRRIHQDADRREAGEDHPRGRPRAISREGKRPQLYPAVRSERSPEQRREREYRGPAQDRGRPGPRFTRLSADPECRLGPCRGRRGADAPQNAGRHLGSAEPVHSRRGANRRHPGARALGDTDGVRPSCWPATTSASSASTSRQSSSRPPVSRLLSRRSSARPASPATGSPSKSPKGSRWRCTRTSFAASAT